MPTVSSKKITEFNKVDIQPMLATLTDKPFVEPGWIYEIKWDGYRTIAYINKGEVQLRSRNNKSFDDKFYPVTKAFSEFKMDAVIDGETVAFQIFKNYKVGEAKQTDNLFFMHLICCM